MTLRIKQRLDSNIEVQVNQAFAMVSFLIVDVNGQEVIVDLDMESSIVVLRHMDNGPAAIKQMTPVGPAMVFRQSPQRKWWQLW